MSFLSDLIVRIKGDNKPLKDSLNDSERSVNKFSGAMKTAAKALVALFAIDKIIAFGKESVALAAKMEGVKAAFEHIAIPGLLDDLRKATRNTVGDFELMSRAVQASNFQIPLKDLATLLKFASQRAIQTGQSVDYLVDSIVLGIGRKSPLILDNLGISAVRLRQELKGAGVEMTTVSDVAAAVGKIANEEMAKMGEAAETTAVKFGKIKAAWQNIKAGFGESIIQTKAFQEVLKWLNAEAEIWQDKDLSFWQKMNGSPDEYAEWKKRREEVKQFFGIDLSKNAFGNARPFQGFGGAGTTVSNVKTLESLTAELEKEKGILKDIDVADRQAIQTQLRKIKALDDYIKKLQELPIERAAPITKVAAPEMPKFLLTQMVQGANKGKGPELEGLREANIQIEREMTKMEEILTTGRDMAVDLGTQVLEGLGEALTGGNLKDIGKGLLMSLAGFLAQFGKLLITLGLGMTAFVKSLETMNPIIAITAGAAMLVAAGAIRGLASSGAKQFSSGGGGYGGGASMQPQNIKVEVRGKITGKDIVIAGTRYLNDN